MKTITAERDGMITYLNHNSRGNNLITNAVNVFKHLIPNKKPISYLEFANIIMEHYDYDCPQTKAMVDELIKESKERGKK